MNPVISQSVLYYTTPKGTGTHIILLQVLFHGGLGGNCISERVRGLEMGITYTDAEYTYAECASGHLRPVRLAPIP